MKAQISSLDLVFASFVLILILFGVYEAWNASNRSITAYQRNEMVRSALFRTSQQLVKTPGSPSNWQELNAIDQENVNVLGFAREENVLDYEKLDRAKAMDYETFKEVMGIDAGEIYVGVRSASTETPLYSIGSLEGDENARITRYAILNGSYVALEVVLSHEGGGG